MAFALTACGGSSSPTPPTPVATSTANSGPTIAAPVSGSPIYHVIVIIQENRTLDNLFASSALAVQAACSGSGTSYGPYPGANVSTSFTAPNGSTTCLQAVPFEAPYDPSHNHQSLVAELQDQAPVTPPNYGFYVNPAEDTVTGSIASSSTSTPPLGVAFGIIPAPENLLYHELAATYALADDMYASRLAPTFPGHQFLIAGQSTASDDPIAPGATPPPAPGSPYDATNPVNWGCDSATGSTVPVFTDSGGINNSAWNAATNPFPCFNYMTIGDLMDKAGVSWKYYTGQLGNTIEAAFNGYDAIQHIRQSSDWNNNISTPETNILADIQNCQLPNVAYVTPPGLSSDHAGSLSASGPGWVGSIYLAIAETSATQTNKACQYYGTTAIILTWDDSGGWYDHVTPPVVGGAQWGFRVPLIVASAWSQHGASGGLPYVSHTQRDFGSILKYIETNWNLGTLGAEDANADNLSDMFNYKETPITPIASSKMRQLIQQAHFNIESAKRDRTPPDND
jgi:phospholipase C